MRTGSMHLVVVALVRAEGDQPEVPVLQRRRCAERRRDLVHELLVVAPHPPPGPSSVASVVTTARTTDRTGTRRRSRPSYPAVPPVPSLVTGALRPFPLPFSYICLRSRPRRRDSCRWQEDGEILKFQVAHLAVAPPARRPPGIRHPESWRCPMLGPVLLAAARSDSIRRIVAAAPVTRPVVNRFVAGERLDESMAAVRSLAARGMEVTLDHLGEDITDPAEALRNRDAYLAADRGAHGAGPRRAGRDVRQAVRFRAGAARRPRAGAARTSLRWSKPPPRPVRP